MNKQKMILNQEDILNTYKARIPNNQLETLNFRKWFPLYEDSFFVVASAYLIGKIMGDGNLDPHFVCRFIGQEEDLKSLKEFIKKTYSIKNQSMSIRYKKAKGESFMLQINDCLFGRLLYCFGAPMGNKTKGEFLVPNWILSSKKYSKYFLQAIFEDELATIKIKREKYFREATFKMSKVEKYRDNLLQFLTQIKNMTTKLSVSCGEISEIKTKNTQKDGSKTIFLFFRVLGNRNNVLNFYNNIGFKFNKYKIKELNKCISKMRGGGFEFGY